MLIVATHYGKRVELSSLSRWWSEDREKYGLGAGRSTSCATAISRSWPKTACT